MNFKQKLDEALKTDLRQQLETLRPQIATAAQNIYDQWQGENDEEIGAGGICDEIANEVSNIITSEIDDIKLDDWGHEGDEHAAIIARRGEEAYLIDIPYSLYETGGGYSWKKIEGVKLEPSDVQIVAI